MKFNRLPDLINKPLPFCASLNWNSRQMSSSNECICTAKRSNAIDKYNTRYDYNQTKVNLFLRVRPTMFDQSPMLRKRFFAICTRERLETTESALGTCQRSYSFGFWTFSLLWRRRCVLRMSCCRKDFEQMWHVYGFKLALCRLLWIWHWELVLNVLSQCWQLNGLTFTFKNIENCWDYQATLLHK